MPKSSLCGRRWPESVVIIVIVMVTVSLDHTPECSLGAAIHYRLSPELLKLSTVRESRLILVRTSAQTQGSEALH